MHRIVIVGQSGAGKTHLAKQVADRLGCDRIALDDLHWLPGWQPQDQATFLKQVDAATSGQAWVCDGNYRVARSMLWPRATCIVWVKPPLWRVCCQGVCRAVRRIAKREVVCNGNRETIRLTFFSKDSVLLWMVRTHRSVRQQIAEDFEGPWAANAEKVVLASRRKQRAWLAGLPRVERGKG